MSIHEERVGTIRSHRLILATSVLSPAAMVLAACSSSGSGSGASASGVIYLTMWQQWGGGHEEAALVSAIKQYEHLHPNIHVVILTFLTTWTAFIGPLIFINNESQFTLSLGLEQYQSSHFTAYNYLMAVSLIFMIPTLILLVAAQRHLVRGIAFSGLKN